MMQEIEISSFQQESFKPFMQGDPSSKGKRCAEALEPESADTPNNLVAAAIASRILRARKDAEKEPMKKRILLVDDDPSVRNAIGLVLESAGYDVTATGDGNEALHHFESTRFNLVLLDLNLAQESGWDVFERLSTQCPLVPIIILTGVNGQYPIARAAGVGALLEKPVEVPVLLKTIEELLAEPEETRLRRMCGYQDDTTYVRAKKGINYRFNTKVR